MQRSPLQLRIPLPSLHLVQGQAVSAGGLGALGGGLGLGVAPGHVVRRIAKREMRDPQSIETGFGYALPTPPEYVQSVATGHR